MTVSCAWAAASIELARRRYPDLHDVTALRVRLDRGNPATALVVASEYDVLIDAVVQGQCDATQQRRLVATLCLARLHGAGFGGLWQLVDAWALVPCSSCTWACGAGATALDHEILVPYVPLFVRRRLGSPWAPGAVLHPHRMDTVSDFFCPARARLRPPIFAFESCAQSRPSPGRPGSVVSLTCIVGRSASALGSAYDTLALLYRCVFGVSSYDAAPGSLHAFLPFLYQSQPGDIISALDTMWMGENRPYCDLTDFAVPP